MEIARKTDYALRMLATLAADPAGVVSVREVARANGVPYSFARSIQHDLALAGIVESATMKNRQTKYGYNAGRDFVTQFDSKLDAMSRQNGSDLL